MGFEAEPSPTVFRGGRLAARGENDTFRGLSRNPLVGVEGSAYVFQLIDKETIQFVAGEAERGLGKATARKDGGSAGENDIGGFHSAELIKTGAKA